MRELEEKNQEIEQVSKEKRLIEETVEKTMEVEVDLKEQTEEIDELNQRYGKALKDKVSVYDELVRAVRQLADRNSNYMKNEVEICRLVNLTSITKKELEQKERVAVDLKAKIKESEKARQMAALADTQIQQKQERVENLNKELHEKDKMIEQLELLLKTKDAQKQQIQMQLTESKQDFSSPKKSPVKVPIRHKPNSPERMVSQASKPNQPIFSDGP